MGAAYCLIVQTIIQLSEITRPQVKLKGSVSLVSQPCRQESETEKVIFMLAQRWEEKERRRRREQASDDERDRQCQNKKGK